MLPWISVCINYVQRGFMLPWISACINYVQQGFVANVYKLHMCSGVSLPWIGVYNMGIYYHAVGFTLDKSHCILSCSRVCYLPLVYSSATTIQLSAY